MAHWREASSSPRLRAGGMGTDMQSSGRPEKPPFERDCHCYRAALDRVKAVQLHAEGAYVSEKGRVGSALCRPSGPLYRAWFSLLRFHAEAITENPRYAAEYALKWVL